MNKDTPKFYRFCKKSFSKIFLWYYNPKVLGKENIINDGPVMYIGNHRHFFDPCFPIICSDICIHYMVKENYYNNKKIRWFFKGFACLCVYNNKKSYTSISTALKILKAKGAIGIFPEGTRNKSEDKILLDFKEGAVALANKSNSYIVPVGITGKYKFRSKDLVVNFGKPFKVTEMETKEANLKLYNEIKKLIEENKK